MRPGDRQSEISEELPEARQLLARALCRLHDSTAVQNGARMSYPQLARAMKAGHIQGSSFTRYLNGTYVPPEWFVVGFYKTIDELTPSPPPLTCEELLDLRVRAEATDRRRHEARQRLIEENKQQALAPTADKADAVALPVPCDTGDRQGNEFAESPAPQAAIEAIQLAAQGHDAETVTLLSRLSEHLNTNEVALCVVHFRLQHYDDLAATLIRIFGRDHREDQRQQQVIRLSMKLREHKLHNDADALLAMLV